MKIVCIKAFKDKTTAKNIEDQKLVRVNDVLVCDDDLAIERIQKGLAKKVVEEVVEESTEEVVVEEKKPRKRK